MYIDAAGRVTSDPETARRLATSQGRFRLVPTSGDLLVLQRLEPTPGEAGAARVTLAGEIDRTGALVDVIHLIHGGTWSGQLAVLTGTVRKTLYFRRGDVQTAASNVPEDRLGSILYRFGIISEEALHAALRMGGSAKLGQRLVAEGALTAHELYQWVRKQVEEIFFSLLVLSAGEFYFTRTGADEGPPSQLLLPTQGLLFNGVRRIDEMSYFRERIPSAEALLHRREPPPGQKLEPLPQRLYDLVDGQRPLSVLARESHLGEFEATKLAYQLLQLGFVQIRQVSPPLEIPTAPSERTADAAHARIVRVFNEVFAKIHAAVAAKGREDALRQAIDSFFGSVAEFAPLYVGLAMMPDGTLSPEALLNNLQFVPADDRLDYLHRGLNELLFFELFTAGEAVDRREEIELHQRLNQILREVELSALEPEIGVEPG